MVINVALSNPTAAQILQIKELLHREPQDYVFLDMPARCSVMFIDADEDEPNLIRFDREEDRASMIDLLDSAGIAWYDFIYISVGGC